MSADVAPAVAACVSFVATTSTFIFTKLDPKAYVPELPGIIKSNNSCVGGDVPTSAGTQVSENPCSLDTLIICSILYYSNI